MLGDEPGWGVRVRVWVERDGRKVLGPGRVELLGLIDTHHSISAAARAMGMSYRRAWELVRDTNEAAGEPLVELTTGGAGGGGATLTSRGRDVLALYARISTRITGAADEVGGPTRVG
jgi:molybdate transport system regulatory protein